MLIADRKRRVKTVSDDAALVLLQRCRNGSHHARCQVYALIARLIATRANAAGRAGEVARRRRKVRRLPWRRLMFRKAWQGREELVGDAAMRRFGVSVGQSSSP